MASGGEDMDGFEKAREGARSFEEDLDAGGGGGQDTVLLVSATVCEGGHTPGS